MLQVSEECKTLYPSLQIGKCPELKIIHHLCFF